MCPSHSEMDLLFGYKPNVTPIASYYLQEKDSLNGDDDDVSLDKENNGLKSPLNRVPLLHNEDDLVQVENLQDESVTENENQSLIEAARLPNFSQLKWNSANQKEEFKSFTN
ncbi:hypothetical protein O181_119972, partial [Austropuccinia psidii MF-1]|nr:hypothetical protein [Austropuccinia psidii MF-1]